MKVDDPGAKPLTPADVPVGATQTMAWPLDPMDGTVRSGSRLNRVLLVRLDPATLAAETLSRAADGVVAYTAICTHTGCEVIDWHADEQLLYCPCHYSRFDPKDGARVVDGPAPADPSGAAASDDRRTAGRGETVHHACRLRAGVMVRTQGDP